MRDLVVVQPLMHVRLRQVVLGALLELRAVVRVRTPGSVRVRGRTHLVDALAGEHLEDVSGAHVLGRDDARRDVERVVVPGRRLRYPHEVFLQGLGTRQPR